MSSSSTAYQSQILREITAALAAAGCGIIRREPPPMPVLPKRTEAAEVEAVRDILIRKDIAYPSMKTLLQLVAAVTGIPVAQILSESRVRPVCRARQILMYVARDVTGRSLPAIGRAIGGMDHSTVLHGVRKVEGNRGHFEPELSRILELLRPQS